MAPAAGHKPFNCALIDLDDCLYRVEEVSHTVRQNIERYIHQHLNIPEEQVAGLTQELYYGYGTTLAGLRARGFEIDVDHFHATVHGTLDYERLLQPDPRTRELLLSMDCPRYLLTNADRAHAKVCLERLGIQDCFLEVFDYETVQELARSRGLLTPQQPLLCKPCPQVYELVISAVGGELSTTLFLDDSVRNIAAAHKLGIFSVLVGREGHVAGADACIATFAGLPAVLLQLFVEPLPLRASEDGMEAAVGAGVPIHVPA